MRQEVTIAEAASAQQVDRSTIMRIKQIAQDGALAALAASKPGVKGRERDYGLEAANAEIARLSEACKALSVKLTLVEGKTVGAEYVFGNGRRGRVLGVAGVASVATWQPLLPRSVAIPRT